MMEEHLLHLAPKNPERMLPPLQQGQRSRSEPANPAKILVVEDDYFVSLTIEEALEDAGYEVLGTTTTGEDAVRMGTQLRPDLVLMDIRLAGEMSGIDAALALRRMGIVSIFASAHSDASTRSAGDEAKPAAWLTKPFSGAELITAVAEAVARSNSN
jgi:two-component system, response regulator PdtaR